MIGLETSLDNLLNRYPKLAVLLMRQGLLCVACPVAQFHTVEQAAIYHRLEPAVLLNAIREEIRRLYGPCHSPDTDGET
jgi:hybrid cluster-associated redox disulfide protein